MKRRDFISRTSGAAVAIGLPLDRSLAPAAHTIAGGQAASTEELLALAQAEGRIEAALKTQVVDEKDRAAGGFISPAYGFALAALNAGELKNLGALYCHQRSVHYHSTELARRIDLALGWLGRASCRERVCWIV